MFCVHSPLFCAGLCLIISIVCQTITTYSNHPCVLYKAVGLSIDVGMFLFPPQQWNDMWNVGEKKISSCCDVAVFSGAMRRGSALPVDSVGAFEQGWHYWSHGWRLKALVRWNDGGRGAAHQQIRASAGCVYSVLITTTRHDPYTQWESTRPQPAVNTPKHLRLCSDCSCGRRGTKISPPFGFAADFYHNLMSRSSQHFATLFCTSCFI